MSKEKMSNDITKRTIVKMNEIQANTYVNWIYEKPYDFYNIPQFGIREAILEIFEDNGMNYFSVLDEDGRLFGVYEYTFKSDMMEIGFGIRPEDTGKGFGQDFVIDCINFGRNYFSYNWDIFLRVADFNERAIKLYKKLGFVEFDREITESFGIPITFICMKLNTNEDKLKR